MSENTGADLAVELEILTAATQFEWTWTSADADDFAAVLGWDPARIERDDNDVTLHDSSGDRTRRVRLALNSDGSVFCVLFHLVRAGYEDSPDRDRVLVAFDQVSAYLRNEFGEPVDGTGGTGRETWTLRHAVVDLVKDSTSTHIRLESPAQFERKRRNLAAHAAEMARRTEWHHFLTAIPILAQADLGAWSADDVTRIVESTGWPAETDTIYPEDIVVGLENDGTWISLRASRTPEYLDADRFGFGEFQSLRLTQRLSGAVGDSAYRAALAECVRLLGTPPRVGGPNAHAIWRRSDVTITLSRNGGDTTWLSLEVIATEPDEEYRYWTRKWSDDWTPDECWRATPDRTDDALQESMGADWGYTERPVASWTSFERYLTDLFQSLAADLPLLHPYASCVVWTIGPRTDPEDWFVQGWFRETDCHLEIREPGGQPLRIDHPIGVNSGHAIARTVLATLRGSVGAPDQLWCNAFMPSDTQALWSLRLGLTHD